MNAHNWPKRAALENQAFALMGRLHVILRRHSGRVTDIEYMRTDPAYCRHLLELAAQSEHEDLMQVGARLQEIYFGEHGLFVVDPPKLPLLERRRSPSPAASVSASVPPPKPAPSMQHAIPIQEAPEETPRAYVGRLR